MSDVKLIPPDKKLHRGPTDAELQRFAVAVPALLDEIHRLREVLRGLVEVVGRIRPGEPVAFGTHGPVIMLAICAANEVLGD